MESDDTTLNFMREFLLVEKGVSGFCMYPDMRDLQMVNSDVNGIYQFWAEMPEQTHSCNVDVTDGYRSYFPDTDALITFHRNVAIGVRTADCVPILLYSPDKQAIAAIHAGWKGTLGGIVDNVMDILEDRGVDPYKLKVAFGPSISKDVYEVSAELAKSFISAGFDQYVSSPSGLQEKPHIDLQGVNMERFIRRGVKPENIKLHSGCSYSSKRVDGTPKYASHRRSGGAPTRMLTCIMMLPEEFLNR